MKQSLGMIFQEEQVNPSFSNHKKVPHAVELDISKPLREKIETIAKKLGLRQTAQRIVSNRQTSFEFNQAKVGKPILRGYKTSNKAIHDSYARVGTPSNKERLTKVNFFIINAVTR